MGAILEATSHNTSSLTVLRTELALLFDICQVTRLSLEVLQCGYKTRGLGVKRFGIQVQLHHYNCYVLLE